MALFFASSAPGQPVASYITETVSIPNGGLTLRAVLAGRSERALSPSIFTTTAP